MRLITARSGRAGRLRRSLRPGTGTFVMAILIPVLATYLIWPTIWVLFQSFNVAGEVFVAYEWGLSNWRVAWADTRVLTALRNTFLVWGLTALISFPTSIVISWSLARVRMPFSYPLEYLFWVAYVTPGAAIAWILLLEPTAGFINVLLQKLPLIDLFLDERGRGPFNIFIVPGIIWTNLMANGIALKVMILTPAFRNMDLALEEAARVSGSSTLRTMLRVTMPLMAAPIILVLALQLVRIFSGFETEWLLGRPIGFFVYSTLIFEQVIKVDPPNYGIATVMAAITIVVIAAIVPLQRWILTRRRYTTITGSFRPGLIDIGGWKWLMFGGIVGLHAMLTLVQVIAFVLASVMTRSGFFNVTPVFTLDHWRLVWSDDLFLTAARTTVVLAFAAGILSPVLFSVLAYIMVRTRWPGRVLLDWIIWGSAAVPGLLSGLGLLMVFLTVPGLTLIYGTIWALLLVVIISGNTTGVNLSKAAIVQVGADMEEAARVAGSGWLRTYVKLWLPLLMPLMILLATLNFVSAAGATASVILLASRETITLSILALQWASNDIGRFEAAGIVSLHITLLTLGVAAVARRFGLNMGVRHR